MPTHGILMFRGSVRLARRLHAARPFDCIDAHYVYPDGLAAVLLGRALGIPVVVSARGTDINLFPSFFSIRPLMRWTLQRAAGIIAVSAALKQAIGELGVPPEKIRVIPNGIDLERFQAVEREVARRHLNLPPDAEIVVSVGSLIPSKGFQFLIPAIGSLTYAHPKLKLYVVGAGQFRSALQEMIERLSLQDRAFLVGAKPHQELKYWFSAANVSCLLSSREGQPNVILESLACGTPVVSTRVGGVPETLTSSELGMLVAQDERDVASALDVALKTSWNRPLLVGHAARRTWETVAAEVEDYLASCCGSAPPRAHPQ